MGASIQLSSNNSSYGKTSIEPGEISYGESFVHPASVQLYRSFSMGNPLFRIWQKCSYKKSHSAGLNLNFFFIKSNPLTYFRLSVFIIGNLPNVRLYPTTLPPTTTTTCVRIFSVVVFGQFCFCFSCRRQICPTFKPKRKMILIAMMKMKRRRKTHFST